MSAREDFLRESEYVEQAFDAIEGVAHASNKQRLIRKGQELKRIVEDAVRDDRTSRRDLITIQNQTAVGMGLSDLADQQSGGVDTLLYQRKMILQEVYDYLDAVL